MNGYDEKRPTDTPEYRKCPICGELVDWDTMVWLNGRCTCPSCYEHLRRELDTRRRLSEDEEP